MAFEFTKHRWQKTLLIILLVFVSLILIAAFLVNRYWSPILSDKLKTTVTSSTDSLYQVNFDDAQLHILKGKILVYNLTLKPDTAVYNRMKKAHLAPNNLYNLRVKKLVLSHIHPFSLYFKHKLNIGEISLNAPELKISYQLNHAKDTVVKDKRTIYQKIAKSLKMIHVGSIMFNDVKLRYENHKGPQVAVSEFKELNLSATDLLIDSATQFDSTRFLYCRSMDAELNNYSGKSLKGLYTYKIKQLKFSTATRQLGIYNCDFSPTEKPFTFFDKSLKDRFNAHLDSLTLNNFDFTIYNKYHSIIGSSLILTQGSISVFSNPRLSPLMYTDKLPTFPNEAIHLVPFDIKIDTVKVKKIDVTYLEYNTKTKRQGHVNFNNVSGSLYNVTNNPLALQKNNMSKVKLTSRFMNKAKLDLDFTFNLTDKLRSYSYKGKLGPMNLPAVNAATVPLASIAIKSGQIKSMTFDIHANSKGAAGNVTVLYNNLKIQLLKADTAKLKMRHMAIASLLVNALIIKKNNPDDEGKLPRSIAVTVKRLYYFPFFKSIWVTLLNGLKPSVGLDEKTQKNINDRMAQHEKDKQEKKSKKELRKQKREEKKQQKKLKKAAEKAQKDKEKYEKKKRESKAE